MGRISKFIISMLLVASMLPFPSVSLQAASDKKISGITASGTDDGTNTASLAVDGKASTYWKSAGDSSMQDYRRFLDFDLNGEYQVSKILIKQNTGSYYHYEVYASDDGVSYDKIAYKANNDAATTEGDSYSVNVTARYLRVNVSYNSSAQSVNIAELEVYGEKTGEALTEEELDGTDVSVTAFEDSEWGKEWDRFENDETYANQKVISEMSNLVGRVIGSEWTDKFVFEFREAKNDKDVFEIQDGDNGRILIRGNNGISMASGFNYYLRYYAKVDYNPLFASYVTMPDTLPTVGEKVVKYTDYDYRYALNFCTYSYTMAFWDWDDYEPFLDWCAMNGVNLVLDIVGQEEVLRETLTQYGYTTAEVKEYISGPAYYAWFYMQNLYAAGGPLPNAWFEQRVELGRQIHDRMQTYGIQPVIQGFGGQVPTDFQEKNPTSVAASSGSWCGYDRPYMIKTYLTDSDIAAGKEDYFQKVGTTFYETQEKIFGKVSHYYAVDPFHEGGTVPSGFNIVDIYRVVQEKMLSYDEDAIWVMQQWQSGINETKLSGLANKEQAIVLDLQSDLRSQASPMENQGVPWIWNMLHNFGGRMGLDGVPEIIATAIPEAYKNNNYMVGIGITPEAIENSPLVYELLFDMTWEQDPINYRSWTKAYAERRYGGTDENIEEAWDILLDTVYSYNGSYYQGASESVINARPSAGNITSASTWGHSDINYDKEELERAAQLFIDSYDKYKDSDAFMYDFVDVMRQVLANAAQEYQPLMGQAYQEKNLEEFQKLSTQFLEIIDMQDQILSSSDGFLLGTWIDDARTMLGSDMDDWSKDLFEYNARALLTTWGMKKSSEGGGLNDYSNRQWAGLTGEYYYSRWETWINNRIKELNGESYSDPNWYMYGLEWATRKSDEGYSFSTKASGADVKELAQTILDKYSVGSMDSFVDGTESEERIQVSLNKTITEVSTGDTVQKLTDGDTSTGWTAGKTETTLEMDLEGTYSIESVGFTLQQAAISFPVKYVMEVWDGEKWIEVGSSDADTITTKNEVSCSVTGSKVRYTFTSANGENLVDVYELQVYGTAQKEVTYENIAQYATFTASSYENESRSPEKVADGDYTSLWINRGAYSSGSEVWLKASYDTEEYVDLINLYFESGDRYFKFMVTGTTADGETITLLDKSDNDSKLDTCYTIKVGQELKEVKVEFKGSAQGTPWPAIAELEIMQSVQEKVLENIAPTATATSSASKASPEDASALIDGTTTAWVSANGAVPAWVQLDLPEQTSVEELILQFEKGEPDRSMQFTVTIYDEAGNSEVVYERTASDLTKQQGIEIEIPLSRSTIAKKLKTVRVDITADKVPSTGGNAWPLIAEIEIMKEVTAELPVENVSVKATATSSASKASPEDASALIDGTTTAWVSANGAVPAWVQLDLPSAENAQEIVMQFEKGQSRSMQFTVTTTDEDGKSEVVYERTADDLNTPQGEEIRIDVTKFATARKLKSVRVDITAAKIPNSSNAWPLIAELEVYALPKNVAENATITSNDEQLTTAELEKLLDASNEDTVTLDQDGNKVITMTLDRGYDLNILELLSSGTNALRFKVEYQEPTKSGELSEYKTWLDYSNNREAHASLLAQSGSTVYAKNVRITFYNSEVQLTGIRLYETDMSYELTSYIAALEKELSELSYGNSAGKYTPEAKQVLTDKIAEANAAVDAGLNSEGVAEWIDTLTKAYRTFYETGYVQLVKQYLYAQIEDAESLCEILKDMDLTTEADALNSQIEAADQTLSNADVTQEEIDAAKLALANACSDIQAKLPDIEAYKVALAAAKKAKADAVVGEYEGQYPQSAVDTLSSEIEDAEDAFAALNQTATAVDVTEDDEQQLASAPEAEPEEEEKTDSEEEKATVEEEAVEEEAEETTEEETEEATEEETEEAIEEETEEVIEEVTEEETEEVIEEVTEEETEEVIEEATEEETEEVIEEATEEETEEVIEETAEEETEEVTEEKTEEATEEEEVTSEVEKVTLVEEESETPVLLTEAQIDDVDAYNASVRALAEKLIAAREEFLEKVIHIDTTELDALIAAIDKLTASSYDADTWDAMQVVYEEAAAIDKDQISQTSVDDLKAELEEKYEALVLLDRTSLSGLIASYDELSEENYTADSWKVFSDALTAAKEAYEKESISQSDLDQAAADLQAAASQLCAPIDSEELEELISAVADYDQTLYSEITWQNLQNALAYAEKALANASTQEEIDSAMLTLNNAIKGLCVVDQTPDPDDQLPDADDKKPDTSAGDKKPGTNTGNKKPGTSTIDKIKDTIKDTIDKITGAGDQKPGTSVSEDASDKDNTSEVVSESSSSGSSKKKSHSSSSADTTAVADTTTGSSAATESSATTGTSATIGTSSSTKISTSAGTSATTENSSVTETAQETETETVLEQKDDTQDTTESVQEASASAAEVEEEALEEEQKGSSPLAWIVIFLIVLAGILVFYFGRKKKNS